MSEPRKRPGVGFWATVVLTALVLYVASFGPACWATTVDVSRPGGPRFHAMMIAYLPLGFVANEDNAAAEILQWWMGLGAPDDGRYTFVPTNWAGTRAIGFRGNSKVSSSDSSSLR